MDEGVNRCEVFQAFGKAPHLPVEGPPSVSALDEKIQVDLPFSDDNIVLRAMGAYSKYAVLVCVCVRRIPWRYGKPVQDRGLMFSGDRRLLKWIWPANWEMG